MHDPQGAHRFHTQMVNLIGIGTAADPGDRFQPVYRASRSILLDESLVARLFHLSRDFVYRIVPRNILPFGTTRSAHQGLKQAPIVHDLLLQRGTLRAQRAAVGRLIGAALNVNHSRGHILRAVANRVDNGAAANRTAPAGPPWLAW